MFVSKHKELAMSVEIVEVTDYKRGCGWREPGGLYLRCDGPARSCGMLPLELTTCTVCGRPWHQTRGWTFVDAGELFLGVACHRPPDACDECLLRVATGRAGLLWVGRSHYRSDEEFLAESRLLGVSKRIPNLPDWWTIGRSIVLLAHPRAMETGTSVTQAGVFAAFIPTRVEYVITGDESAEDLERLADRGFTLVRVTRGSFPEPAPLFGNHQ
jgi:hypothetical protein